MRSAGTGSSTTSTTSRAPTAALEGFAARVQRARTREGAAELLRSEIDQDDTRDLPARLARVASRIGPLPRILMTA